MIENRLHGNFALLKPLNPVWPDRSEHSVQFQGVKYRQITGHG